MKPRKRSSGYWLVIALLCSGAFPLETNAAASYLQELKAEAAKVDGETEGKTPSTPTPNIANQPINPSDTIKAGLSKEKFEEQLQKNYYGSYLFYATLLEAQQQKVYTEYQQDNHIDSIRESIKSKLKR